MSIVELKVTSTNYNCRLSLERRVTYLRGMSGSGKTAMVNAIRAYNRGNRFIEVDCSRKVVIGEDIPSKEVFSAYKGCIVIYDDLLLNECRSFDSDLVDFAIAEDVYIVIINRVESDEEVLNRIINKIPELFSPFEYSVESILECKNDGGKNHWFEKQADNTGIGCCFSDEVYDCIITEDTYGSTDLAKTIFNVPVISAHGKDKILSKVKEAENRGYKKIFVFADMAAFGRNFHTFKVYCESKKNIHVYLDRNYECFEYLLLLSNMLKDEFKFNQDEANTYHSWESYFEAKIKEITSNKMYKYAHGSGVRKCYLVNCDDNEYCNEHKKPDCGKYIESDKIVYMFKGTIFEYLISMRDNML